ncbi:tRNA (cytosine(38)-C(5))-methyltransferase isoform X4 [Melospiza melodia melodia]|uniref:tRNA (cytosine(38)-C(5))-methyltransferase isoform X4 n=1 Tax=Melospiza melodia melodia TaxID=1914991 RepID=UPI002FD55870
MLWDSQRRWLMEILTISDMKKRQLRVSLSTTLGIIHKLLVVICAVYCNAFPCNSSVQSCSCLVSPQHHLYRSRSEITALLKIQTESCTYAEVVAAVDVNTLANDVYKHNFPSTPLWAKTIEGITLKEFDRLSFDMILMSPPCQPFTRIGLQGDVSDPRTKSFLYILDILPRLQKLPKYLLLENVKGFESSSARNELLQTLTTCGFKYQEFLLSPTCLGVPNSRLRYFLIAKLHQEPFSFQAPGQILTRFPDQDPEDLLKEKVADKVDEASSLSSEEKNLDPNIGPDCSSKKSLPKGAFLFKLETVEEMERKHNQDNDPSIQMLKDFLEEENEEMSQYFLPPKSLLRYALLLDIVKPTCRRSTCFTKGYF